MATKRTKKQAAADPGKPEGVNPTPAAKKRPPIPRSKAAKREHAQAIYAELRRLYPDAHCALDHASPFQLLIATILSAQCTDERVNKVTPELFTQYPTPQAMADASQEQLEELVRTTGFFRNKAKSIKGAATTITEKHSGEVPQTMKELTALPGVARKTANVVLGDAFNISEGVVVDTHVGRLSQRLGLTKHADPKKVEKDLMALFDPEQWTLLAHLLIFHGRQICNARKPKCEKCSLADICPKVGVAQK